MCDFDEQKQNMVASSLICSLPSSSSFSRSEKCNFLFRFSCRGFEVSGPNWEREVTAPR